MQWVAFFRANSAWYGEIEMKMKWDRISPKKFINTVQLCLMAMCKDGCSGALFVPCLPSFPRNLQRRYPQLLLPSVVTLFPLVFHTWCRQIKHFLLSLFRQVWQFLIIVLLIDMSDNMQYKHPSMNGDESGNEAQWLRSSQKHYDNNVC